MHPKIKQWPATTTLRKQYANYLVNDLNEDVPGGAIQLADYFSTGLISERHDGFVTFANTKIMCTDNYNPPSIIYAETLVDLAAECLLKKFHGLFVAAFVYSRYFSAGSLTKPFWEDLFNSISWLFTPSSYFVTLFSIMRSDLQQFVLRARQNMSLALQSNKRVDHAMNVLIGGSVAQRSPWHVSLKSSIAETLKYAICNAQIIIKWVKPNHKPFVDVLFASETETVGLIMAERDRLLLAILLLYAESNGAMGDCHKAWQKHLPDDAPQQFHECKTLFPELWTNSF